MDYENPIDPATRSFIASQRPVATNPPTQPTSEVQELEIVIGRLFIELARRGHGNIGILALSISEESKLSADKLIEIIKRGRDTMLEHD